MGMDYHVYIETLQKNHWVLSPQKVFQARSGWREGKLYMDDGTYTVIKTECCNFMYGFSDTEEIVVSSGNFEGMKALKLSPELWLEVAPYDEGYKDGDEFWCMYVMVATLKDWQDCLASHEGDDDAKAMIPIYEELVRRIEKLIEDNNVKDVRIITLLL